MNAERIKEKLRDFKKKSITEQELKNLLNIRGYEEFYNVSEVLISENILEGMGKLNKMPKPMYSKFRIKFKQTDALVFTSSQMYQSLSYMYPKFNYDYYKNPTRKNQLNKDYPYIKILSDYMNSSLVNDNSPLKYPLSTNERSFEIWKDEKYLESDEGKSLLSNLKITYDDINTYKAKEPYFDYYNNVMNNGSLLIVENKDTWYSLKRLFPTEGNLKLLGVEINVLVYGEGNKILSSLEYLEEKSYKSYVDSIYYIGDLDYEGISILNRLVERYPGYYIRPFMKLYEKMLEKSGSLTLTKPSKNKQKRYKIEEFIKEIKQGEYLENLLEKGLYVPQEILSCKDMERLTEEGAVYD